MLYPLDVHALLRALRQAEDSGDVQTLVYLAGLFAALAAGTQERARRCMGLDATPSPPPPEGRLLTAAEAAKIAGPSFDARWFYRHAHELPCVRRVGRRLFFAEAELRVWLTRR